MNPLRLTFSRPRRCLIDFCSLKRCEFVTADSIPASAAILICSTVGAAMVLTLMATMSTSLLEKESKTRRRAALLESAFGVRRFYADWLAVVILLVGVLRFWVC